MSAPSAGEGERGQTIEQWMPFAQQSQQQLLQSLSALGIEPPTGDRSRAALTVELGRAMGRDVSGLVAADGSVLCRAALFSASGKCPRAATCRLSHDIPADALAAAHAHVAASRQRAAAERAVKEASARHALSLPQPGWLERRRRARVLCYDTSLYGLREALAAVLELDRFLPDRAAAGQAAQSDLDEAAGEEGAGGKETVTVCALPLREGAQLSAEALERRLQLLHSAQPEGLHGAPPLCPALLRGLVLAGRTLPARWKRAHRDKARTIQRLHASGPWQALMAAYDRFVQEVVAPACVRAARQSDDGEGGSGGCSGSEADEGPREAGGGEGAGSLLIYQRPPTVRVHMPGRVSPIGLHCDADYPQHEGAEINVWVPLTSCHGSSALWLESAPGAADFAPVELRYGQALIFNGCRCRHYAMANATGATRVSFDFRAIPAEAWRDDYGGHIGDYPAARCTAAAVSGASAQDAVCVAGQHWLVG